MKNNKHLQKNNFGFSLVELIIVIAIMAVLAGAIAPAVIKYIRKARASRATDEARLIVNAIEVCLASSHAEEMEITMDKTYTDPSGNSHSCGVLTNWMISRAQNNNTSDVTDANEVDYYFATSILEALGADGKTYKFFQFNGAEDDPLGMNCESFSSKYGCPGIIAVYSNKGKVLYLQYYNYGCLIEYVAGEGYELIDDENFVDSPTIQ